MATQTAKGSGSTVNNGATILNGGNIDSTSTVTNSPTILGNIDDGAPYGSQIVRKVVGDAHGDGGSQHELPRERQGGIETARGAGTGTLAFNPSSIAHENGNNFVIRGYSSKLNNAANTAIYFPGSDTSTSRVSIHSHEANRRYDVTRWNHVTGVASSGGANGASFSYIDSAGNGTAVSADSAAAPTRAIPGELVYMYGAKTPKQDDYKAKNG